MQHDHLILQTGFGSQTFEIECNNEDAYSLAKFLFCDFPGASTSTPPKRYDIIFSGLRPMLSLWRGDTRLYFGDSRYQLAYLLMNEVIYYCIDGNTQDHAIHAGAVGNGKQCIILPGKSGKGKSTLTAWLIANGYEYLTDELIFLAEDGQVSPLIRPISMKAPAYHLSQLLPGDGKGTIMTCDSGSMIPHRLLNPKFSPRQWRVSHIIFPEFQKGAETTLSEVSSAQSCLYLMQCHVNARSLDGHGISEISAIVRRCRSYRLTYGSFDRLKDVFCSSTSPFQ